MLRQSTSIIALVALLLQLVASTGALAVEKGRTIKASPDQTGNAPASNTLAGESRPSRRTPIVPRTTDLQSAPRSTAPVPAPRAGIPVLENALGDLDNDSVDGVRDLVRIGEIIRGLGPPASTYELQEGDLDVDGALTSWDVERLRAIIMRTRGPQFVIGVAGGVVSHNTSSILVPPGALDSSVIMSVRQISASQLDSAITGNPIATLSGVGASYMAGLEITAIGQGGEFPFQLREEMMGPPPASGQSGLYIMKPDQDGNGGPDLRKMSELHVSHDSVYMQSDSIVLPTTSLESSTKAGRGSILLFPGDTIPVLTNMASASSDLDEIEITCRQLADIRVPLVGWMQDPNDGVTRVGVFGIVPALAPGTYDLSLEYLPSGLKSLIGVLEVGVVSDVPDADSILSNYTAFAESLYVAYQSTQDPLLADLSKWFLDIGMFYYWRDSILPSYALDKKLALARFVAPVLAAGSNKSTTSSSARTIVMQAEECRQAINQWGVSGGYPVDDFCVDCRRALHEAIQAYVRDGLLDAASDATYEPFWKWVCDIPVVGLLCGIRDAGAIKSAAKFGSGYQGLWDALEKLDRDMCDPLDPPPQPKCKSRTVDYSIPICLPSIPSACVTYAICLHLDQCDPTGECDPPPPPCPPDGCGSSQALSLLASDASMGLRHSMAGALVSSPSNPLIPTAIVDRNGHFSLLVPPGGGYVDLAVYDPASGLYDEHFWSGDLELIDGRFVPIGALFDPAVAICRKTLEPGIWVVDTVGTCSRHEFVLNVSESVVGVPLTLGFASAELLTLWIQNPDGEFTRRDSLELCAMLDNFIPSIPGQYLITVAGGQSGGDGPFVVGANYVPYPPIPYLCDAIPWDTLYANYSPYISTAASSVATGDSVMVQAGTAINFEPGGSITAAGKLRGTGTEANPIVLSPVPNGSVAAPTRISAAHFPGAEAD